MKKLGILKFVPRKQKGWKDVSGGRTGTKWLGYFDLEIFAYWRVWALSIPAWARQHRPTQCVSTNTPYSLLSHSLFLFLYLTHSAPFKIFSNHQNPFTLPLQRSTTFFFSLFLSSLMADNLDDGEFWLPPQFLADDDVPATPLQAKRQPLQNDALLFPSEFPYGFPSSELASPVDSTAGGSSETESDEEEQLVAELSLRVAQSSLQTDNKSVVWITTITLFVFFSLPNLVLFRTFS